MTNDNQPNQTRKPCASRGTAGVAKAEPLRKQGPRPGRGWLTFRCRKWRSFRCRLTPWGSCLLPDQPVPLLKKRLELIREEALKLWSEKLKGGEGRRQLRSGSHRRFRMLKGHRRRAARRVDPALAPLPLTTNRMKSLPSLAFGNRRTPWLLTVITRLGQATPPDRCGTCCSLVEAPASVFRRRFNCWRPAIASLSSAAMPPQPIVWTRCWLKSRANTWTAG